VSEIRGPVAIAAGRIVEEAVANACRHGLAESVMIRASWEEGPAIRFVIDDDGSGPTGGTPGLGTAMLAGISRGDLALTPRPEGGSRLSVVLPID
jgi:signal transduction histidine kinase